MGRVLTRDERTRAQGGVVQKVDAVTIRGNPGASELQQRRHDVHRAGRVVDRHRLDMARPADDDRRTDATIEGRHLRTLKVDQRLVGARDPTVVGDVDNDGVLREAFLLEVGTDVANGLVEPFHHRQITGRLDCRCLTAVLREDAFGRRVRIMRHHRRIPGEERLTVLLGAGNELRQRSERLAPDVETFVTMATTLGHALGEAAVRVVAHPPFPSLQADVTTLR